MNTRSGGLEIAFYRNGVTIGKPTVNQWCSRDRWTLRSADTTSGPNLFSVTIEPLMDRPDGWILTNTLINVNQMNFGQYPVLFRFGKTLDTLPTGVIPFEVPVWDWDAKSPKVLTTEMWHVTIRGCGAE